MHPEISVHLLIETSGRGGFVGLARNGNVVHTAALDESRRHARDLAESVRRILATENLQPKDITGVFVSIGPGSYTGLRVGLASAKAFAYAVGCPLVAVPTFHAIVENMVCGYDAVHVIADALQGQVYLQTFESVLDEWKSSEPLRIANVRDLQLTHSITGPGVTVYDAILPANLDRVEESRRSPTIEGLWHAGKNLKPLTREEMFAVEPLYLRGSSAEEKRKAQSEPVKASSAS